MHLTPTKISFGALKETKKDMLGPGSLPRARHVRENRESRSKREAQRGHGRAQTKKQLLPRPCSRPVRPSEAGSLRAPSTGTHAARCQTGNSGSYVSPCYKLSSRAGALSRGIRDFPKWLFCSCRDETAAWVFQCRSEQGPPVLRICTHF